MSAKDHSLAPRDARTSRRTAVKVALAALATTLPFRPWRESAAAGMAQLTVHVRSCPVQTPGDIYAQCHNRPVPGATVSIRSAGATTVRCGSAQGNTKTLRIPARKATIALGMKELRKASALYVYCADITSGRVLFDGKTTTAPFAITPMTGENVVCDVYLRVARASVSPAGNCVVATATPIVSPSSTVTSVVSPTSTPDACPSPCDFCPTAGVAGSLQEAIDDAAAGDTICLGEGNYIAASGETQVGKALKSLTIKGKGQDKSYIEVGLNNGGLLFGDKATADIAVTLADFTVINRLGRATLSEAPNASITFLGHDRCTLTITDVTADSGGSGTKGIGAAIAVDSGGAGVTSNYTRVTVRDHRSMKNSLNQLGYSGGGISQFYGSITMTNCSVTDNYAAGDGGAFVLFFVSSATIDGGTFTGNSTAGRGGFGYGFGGPVLTMLNSPTISGNAGTIGCNGYYNQGSSTCTPPD